MFRSGSTFAVEFFYQCHALVHPRLAPVLFHAHGMMQFPSMTPRERFDKRGSGDDILERRFILQTLREQGREIHKDQTKVIEKHDLILSRDMLRDRTEEASQSGMSGELELRFRKYLRFHDMKKKKKPGQKRRGRAYPLYNKILFGRLAEIQKRLRFGFTEEVKKELSQEIEIPIQT